MSNKDTSNSTFSNGETSDNAKRDNGADHSKEGSKSSGSNSVATEESTNVVESGSTSLKDSFSSGLHIVQSKTAAATAAAKEKVSENLGVAAEQVHLKADQTTDFLDKKADKFGEAAHETIGRINEIGHKAADALSSTSEYVKNFELEQARERVNQTIKEYPGRTVTIAAIFGLAIGLLIGRNRKSR